MNYSKGGPAFPRSAAYGKNEDGFDTASDAQEGMNLRDYFAAKAMQGWLAGRNENFHSTDSRSVAEVAYTMADAMLRARDL